MRKIIELDSLKRFTFEFPKYATAGPEFVDLEVSTICNQACNFCYKGNNSVGKNMSYETFKLVLSKIFFNLKTLAIGIGDLETNPELENMLIFAKAFFIYQSKLTGLSETELNITLNSNFKKENLELYQLIYEYCDSIAISIDENNYYSYKNIIEIFKKCPKRTSKNIYIHKLIHKQNIKKAYGLLKELQAEDFITSIVLLNVQNNPKGLYEPVMLQELDYLSDFDFEFIDLHDYKKFSGSTSCSIDVDGNFSPDTFNKDIKINILDKIFLDDVWYSEEMIHYRKHHLI